MKEEIYNELIELAKKKEGGIYTYKGYKYKVRDGIFKGFQGRDGKNYTTVGFMRGCISETSKSLKEL